MSTRRSSVRSTRPERQAVRRRDGRRPTTRRADRRAPTHERFRHRLRRQLRTAARRAAHPTPPNSRRSWAPSPPRCSPCSRRSPRTSPCTTPGTARVPSQTFCNRSFFHASTSHGFVTNKRRRRVLANGSTHRPSPTIFNRLEDAGISVAHLLRRAPARLVHRGAARTGAREVLAHRPLRDHERSSTPTPRRRTARLRVHRAAHDLQPQRLPSAGRQAARERRRRNRSRRQRDVRRQGGRGADPPRSTPPSSRAPSHRRFERTEHDAAHHLRRARRLYDHVPPPAATPPDVDETAGEMGFRFDRLGCRVPAIAVSAYTRAGTRDQRRVAPRGRHRDAREAARAEAAHPARRRGERHVLGGEPRRPAASADVAVDDPAVHPARTRSPTPRIPGHAHKDKPLSPPARGLLGLLIAKYGRADEQEPETYADAYELLHRYGIGLFGAPR